MKKGQAANETAMIMAVMILFLIAFMGVLGDRLVSVTDDRTRELAEDIADTIEAELALAANSQDGYSRKFTLPPFLDGKEYTVDLLNKTATEANFSQLIVTINTSLGPYYASRQLPDNLFGEVILGDNFVRKNHGIVNVSVPLG